VNHEIATPKVLITDSPPPEHLLPLEGIAEVIKGSPDGRLMSREEVLQHAPDLAAIMNLGELRVDRELLDAAPNLKIVANIAIGTNNLDLPLLAERGIIATYIPDAVVNSTADFTMALLLALTRRIESACQYVRSGAWRALQPEQFDGIELAGKVLGLVGYGKIGQAVARRAGGFDMQVIHYRRQQTDDPARRNLDSLLAESDIVSLHVPLTPETERLMNRQRFEQMKHGSLFINMARGRVVEESALVEALRSCRLAGAGLDVFENEPEVHPALLEMPNVVLTPHIGGATREARKRARLLAAENVARLLLGDLPLTPVT